MGKDTDYGELVKRVRDPTDIAEKFGRGVVIAPSLYEKRLAEKYAPPEEPPIPEAALEEAAKSKSKSRRRKQEPEAPPPPKETMVWLTAVIPSLGSVPTQYRHYYEGDGVLVLGLTPKSYVPACATQGADGAITGILAYEQFPGRNFVYMGNSFQDDKDVKNIILVEI